MTRRISLPLAGATETECGHCAFRSEDDLCHNAGLHVGVRAFYPDVSSGRLPECLAAEAEHARLVGRPSAEVVEAMRRILLASAYSRGVPHATNTDARIGLAWLDSITGGGDDV